MGKLGVILKNLRKEKGLTLEMVANHFDTTAITISRYENGVREPKSDMLNDLANYYDVSVDYLLGRTHKRNSFSNNENTDLMCIINSMANDIEINNNTILFDGDPMTDDERESFLQSLEVVVAMAKKKKNSKLKDI